MAFTPTAYDAQGREIKPGEIVTSRIGDLYMFRSATMRSTPAAFGKVRVARVVNSDNASLTLLGPIPAASDVILTDFAFGLTVR